MAINIDAYKGPRINLSKEEYSAEIHEAEARGKAAAVAMAPAPAAPAPVPAAKPPAQISEPERLAAIDALGFSAEFPELLKEAKDKGLTVEATNLKLISALQSRGANPKDLASKITACVETAKAQGRRITYAQAAEEVQRAEAGDAGTRNDVLKRSNKLQAHIAKAKSEGRTIGPAQAANELEQLGQF